LCFAEIRSTILPSEQTGIEYKKENRALSISPIKNKTRVKFLMNTRLKTKCYFETSGILGKFSTPHTGPNPVTNV
jgi:adenine specific DNA methylase Mod